MPKQKNKSASFEEEVDDSFNILIKQDTGEFVIIHNNNLKCKCMFCGNFRRSIEGVIE